MGSIGFAEKASFRLCSPSAVDCKHSPRMDTENNDFENIMMKKSLSLLSICLCL